VKVVESQGVKPIIKEVFETAAVLAKLIKRPHSTVSTWQCKNNVPIRNRSEVVKAAKKKGFLLTEQQLRGG